MAKLVVKLATVVLPLNATAVFVNRIVLEKGVIVQRMPVVLHIPASTENALFPVLLLEVNAILPHHPVVHQILVLTGRVKTVPTKDKLVKNRPTAVLLTGVTVEPVKRVLRLEITVVKQLIVVLLTNVLTESVNYVKHQV